MTISLKVTVVPVLNERDSVLRDSTHSVVVVSQDCPGSWLHSVECGGKINTRTISVAVDIFNDTYHKLVASSLCQLLVQTGSRRHLSRRHDVRRVADSATG